MNRSAYRRREMSVHNLIKHLCGAALFTVCGAQSRTVLNGFDRGTFTPLPVSALAAAMGFNRPFRKIVYWYIYPNEHDIDMNGFPKGLPLPLWSLEGVWGNHRKVPPLPPLSSISGGAEMECRTA